MGLSTIPEQASHIASSNFCAFLLRIPLHPTLPLASSTPVPFISVYPSRLHNTLHISFTHAFFLRISAHPTPRNRPPPHLIHVIVLLSSPIHISNIFIPFFARILANFFILNNAYSTIGISKAKRGFRLPQSECVNNVYRTKNCVRQEEVTRRTMSTLNLPETSRNRGNAQAASIL